MQLFGLYELAKSKVFVDQCKLDHALQDDVAYLSRDLNGWVFEVRIPCRLCGTAFLFKRNLPGATDLDWRLEETSDRCSEERCSSIRLRRRAANDRRWARLEDHWKTLKQNRPALLS
jgi:hypothetical protein